MELVTITLDSLEVEMLLRAIRDRQELMRETRAEGKEHKRASAFRKEVYKKLKRALGDTFNFAHRN